jgi:zinc protease
MAAARPTVLAAAVVGLLVGPVQAQGLGIVAEQFVLPNGLQVVVIPDARAPAVTQMLWIRAGSSDEPPGQSGAAHFLEHLMFKGTARFPGDFSARIAALGGSDNAFTSNDHTVYVQRVAAEHLPTVMELEADRMTGVVLDAPALEAERGVIVEERGLRTESEPAAILQEQMQAALWLNHPDGRPVIGWRHEIDALALPDLTAFHRARYVASNAVLVLAGDVTSERARALAAQHFGPLPSVPVPTRFRPLEPPQLAARHLTYRDDRVRQPLLLRSYIAPERQAGDQRQAAALAVLAALLAGSTTAELDRRLIHGDGTAVAVNAGYSGTGVDQQAFSLSLIPAEGVSLDEAEQRLDAALADFIKDGPRADDLDRVRIAVRASEIYQRDSQQSLAYSYGAAVSAGLTLDDVAAWPEALLAVTAGDVRDAAARVLDPRQSVTGWLLPGTAP